VKAGYRKPLAALGLLALFGGLWTGLQRIGWDLPSPRPTFSMTHGPLMVCGFVGTVICLERAVAVGRLWAYSAPLAAGVGSLLVLAGIGGPLPPGLILVGSTVLAVMFVTFIRRQPGMATDVMALGVFTWWVGNLLWLLGRPLFDVVHFWSGFLVLTIAGERLELGRLMNLPPTAKIFFIAGIGMIVVGLPLLMFTPGPAVRLMGVGMIALCLWLFRYDLARRTVRSTGLTRFIALSLLAGYAWLGIGGLAAVRYGYIPAGPFYDAMVHAVMVGFIISMIMGHGPIVFPTLMKVKMDYTPWLYSHLALLHVSVFIRIAGDVALSAPLRQWGALLNAAAIILFLVNTVAAGIRWRTKPQEGSA